MYVSLHFADSMLAIASKNPTSIQAAVIPSLELLEESSDSTIRGLEIRLEEYKFVLHNMIHNQY